MVEKDWDPTPETKKEEKHCYVLIQRDENYPLVIVFQVDELQTINLVSIFRLKGNSASSIKSYKTGRVIWTFSSPDPPNRRGRPGLGPILDI